MRARVFVTLKPSVFDPQGKTIVDALHSLGYGGVEDVRQGKYFELELAADSSDKARSMASEVADKLLANPVIESYRIEVERQVQCDSRSLSFQDPTAITTRITRRKKCSARRRSSSGTRRRIFAAPTPSFCQAGSRTAITCGPARSRAFRLSWMPSEGSRPTAGRFSASATVSRSCSRPGLLPGAMLRNRGLKFRCEHVHVRVEQTDTPFTLACRPQQVLRIPIAHGEGNYFTTPDELRKLEQNRQIVFRYVERGWCRDR